LKLTVTITGQDAARLAERVEQLVRTRAASSTPAPDDDPATPAAQSPQRARRDSRS